jgi:hypothetical protein
MSAAITRSERRTRSTNSFHQEIQMQRLRSITRCAHVGLSERHFANGHRRAPFLKQRKKRCQSLDITGGAPLNRDCNQRIAPIAGLHTGTRAIRRGAQ